MYIYIYMNKLAIITDPRYGHVHEMSVILILPARIVLKALQEFQKNLLGDLTPSSL